VSSYSEIYLKREDALKEYNERLKQSLIESQRTAGDVCENCNFTRAEHSGTVCPTSTFKQQKGKA
jgi:hypothetical protein